MMPQSELKSLQYKLLKNLVNKLYDQSRFYRTRMENQGVTPDDIRSL
jgi:phenylacetate-coenzyme A ligase PaaK-like adenylate-forming protein